MRKNLLNFLVDLITLLVMLGMIATGLVIRFILPPGTGGRHIYGHGEGKQLLLWGLGRHDWGDLHFWLAVALGILLILHVALHWRWVCATIGRLLLGDKASGSSSEKQNIYGIGFLAALIALLAGFVWLGFANIETIQQPIGQNKQPILRDQNPQLGYHDDDDVIRGSMTPREIESATGVPSEVIRSELGLPVSVSPDLRLGRLKRQFSLEM
ncbi:MAG: DUF4405 domain-containing protein [Planctomycetota bacterium]|jgi:hypothetical protein